MRLETDLSEADPALRRLVFAITLVVRLWFETAFKIWSLTYLLMQATSVINAFLFVEAELLFQVYVLTKM